MNRSSWASGEGDRCLRARWGFWVATTRKGASRPWVVPSTVTCPSSMASREGGLGLWGGPVDFVAEDDVGEDGAGAEDESGTVAVPYGDAGDVGGEEVWRELDPVEAASRWTVPGTWRGGSCRLPGRLRSGRGLRRGRQTTSSSIVSRLPWMTRSMFVGDGVELVAEPLQLVGGDAH